MKKLACISILAFSFLSLASAAKTYLITLSSPAKVGTLQLKAGEYAVKVEGSNAVFVNQDSDKTFTAPVKVESGAQKFPETAVETGLVGGENVIQDIQLGGTSTQLDFSY